MAVPPSRVLSLDASGHASQQLVALVGSINFGAISCAEGSLLLHAGGVSRGDGSSVVMCAPSGSGKSTLTARLVQRGFHYITDETLAVEPRSLRITDFRKPVSLKAGSHHLFSDVRPDWSREGDPWLIPPTLLGASPPPPHPMLPELVVFPDYRLGADVHVERLAPGEAAFLMGQESSRLRHVRGGPLQALARVARRAPAYRIVHGDVDAAADRIVSLWEPM